MVYQTATNSAKLNIINLTELASRFTQSMQKFGQQGALDFIVGGAGDEWTLRANTLDFNRWQIVPSVMNGLDNESGDTATRLFGHELRTPFIVAPSAAHGLVHELAESGTIKGVQDAGSLMTVSHFSNQLVRDIHNAAPDAPWFYHYDEDLDMALNKFVLDAALESGASAIVIGVFGASFGRRERDLFNQFDFPVTLPFQQLAAYPGYPVGLDILAVNHRKRSDITPENIARIKSYTGLPVIVKGIQNSSDAKRAIDGGADAIWVSNTGGRQLDGARSTIEALPEISAIINKKVPIIFDGGVRRGQHAFKALALGADIIALGRPVLYGLHLGGAQGVADVLEHMRLELENTMLLSGVKNLSELHEKSRLERV